MIGTRVQGKIEMWARTVQGLWSVGWDVWTCVGSRIGASHGSCTMGVLAGSFVERDPCCHENVANAGVGEG